MEEGPSSAVGIATGYGLDGPGIQSRCGRDFLHLSRPALGPNQPPVQWVPGLSLGVKSGRGVRLTPHTLLAPYGPYGLYRASLPVQGCTLHTLPLIEWKNCISCNIPLQPPCILNSWLSLLDVKCHRLRSKYFTSSNTCVKFRCVLSLGL